MIKRFLNSKWLIIRHGVSVVVVFAVLIVALVAISPDISFGWFAQNNTVSANGMAVQAQHNEFTVYYRLPDAKGAWTTAWVPIDDSTSTEAVAALLADINAPGDEVTFQIKVVSASAATLTGFGFAAPSADQEKPVGDGKYYLSTELFTAIASYSSYKANGTLKSEQTLLVNNGATDVDETKLSEATANQENSLWTPFREEGENAGAVDFFEIGEITNGISVAAGDSVIFELKVGFLNRTVEGSGENKADQNIFKNFGDTKNGNTGVFARRFFFTFDDSSNS